MKRVLIESCSRLNLYELMRENRDFNKATVFSPLVNISVTTTINRRVPKAKREMNVPLYFRWKQGTYGGIRLYLSCPRCHRAVTDYYLPHINSEFLCRHCHDLAYSSQSRHRESWWERVDKHDNRQKKIQRKLKNKWLRHPTKTRLILEFNGLNEIVAKWINEILCKRRRRR